MTARELSYVLIHSYGLYLITLAAPIAISIKQQSDVRPSIYLSVPSVYSNVNMVMINYLCHHTVNNVYFGPSVSLKVDTLVA